MLFFGASNRSHAFSMPSATTIPVPDGVARIITRTELQDREEWRQAFHAKYKDHR
ncbi:MAG: hypothetical protein QOI96_1792, partial [Verrucomicrobiota bacterium]